MQQRVCLWLPTDTLLYLPVYALADLGILERVAQAANLRHELVLEILPVPGGGDENAISHMLTLASDPDDDAIHIAISDPVAAYVADEEGEKVALLGAFITRPTFWVLGRDVPPEMESASRKYVYYDQRFQTGNFFGERLSSKIDQKLRVRCAMGEEFKYLFEEELYTGQVHVVTADIVGMVHCMARDPTIRVKKRMVEHYPNFLTTGMLGHRHQLKEYGAEISALLEAIRSACAMFRTAQQPAEALIRQILERGDQVRPALDGNVSLNGAEAKALAEKIAERLFLDNVYSDTLSIEFEDWKQAIRARGWGEERAATRLYYRIYEPQLANSFTAQWLITTFRDYGRFVQEARALKTGALSATFALLISQILLLLMKNGSSYGPVGRRILLTLSVSSAVLAIGAVFWVVAALLTGRRHLFLPVQRVFRIDESATREILTGLAILFSGTVGIWVASFFLPIEFDAGYILFTVTLVITSIVTGTRIYKKRNA